MIGFIVTSETADAILAGIDAAMDARGVPHYWSVGKYQIFTGEHAGSYFLPFDDTTLSTILMNGSKPLDFPESQQLVDMLGGLDARVDLPAGDILNPEAESL